MLTFFIMCIYTTPVYVLQGLTTVVPLESLLLAPNKTRNKTNKLGNEEGAMEKVWTRFMYDTAPVLLLLLFAVTMPSLVTVSDLLAGFWTRSSENRSRMIKTFTFLIIMVIILPSIGLVTLTKVLAERSHKDLIKTVFRWQCILAPQNGEFFVNYMCTATFVGTLSELIRLPEILLFSIYTCCLQSPGEQRSLKLSMLYDFPLGSQYAYTMLYYVTFAVFSFIFPVITPFGNSKLHKSSSLRIIVVNFNPEPNVISQ
ncbi:CSC1-like protein 2 [Folsomia candida]|uniref:CSC1-like protein 2 n=1 Tax=Folsomia candida TaxID=158441 RepID=UPI001604E30A|nr:CSC1-like protein 2 [Folsomia candida]